MISVILFSAFVAGMSMARADDNCEELWNQCLSIENEFFSSPAASQLQLAFDTGETDIHMNDQIRDACGFLSRSAQCTKTVVDQCMPAYGPAADWGLLLTELCGHPEFPGYMATALRCNKQTNILGIIGEVYGEVIPALTSAEPVPEDLPCRFLRLVFRRISPLPVLQQCGRSDTASLVNLAETAVDLFGCSGSAARASYRNFPFFGFSQLKNNRAG